MTKSLILVLAAAAVAGAAAAPLGVPASLQPLYSGATFVCLAQRGDASAPALPASAVNDDFCDCADGSDEPGTSACANGRFYCVNKGARGKHIHSSLVNDGVVDCCDCSDEWAGKARCSNTCEADGATWRAERQAAIQRAEEGARLRREYAEAGKAAAAARAATLAEASAKLEESRAEVAAAEEAVKAAEEVERRETEARKLAAGDGLAAAVQALGIAGLEKVELQRLLVDYMRTSAAAADGLLGFLTTRAEAGTLAPGLAADFKPSWSGEDAAVQDVKTAEGDAARERLRTARAAESRLQADKAAAEKEEEADFGPDAVFYKLKGSCFDVRVNQYKYSICPFKSASQDHTQLGSWAGWGEGADGKPDYSIMRFTNGARCWNGPERSMTVTVECGSVDALHSIDEPEKCVYSSRFTTPAACDGRAAQELRLELDGGESSLEKQEL